MPRVSVQSSERSHDVVTESIVERTADVGRLRAERRVRDLAALRQGGLGLELQATDLVFVHVKRCR